MAEPTYEVTRKRTYDVTYSDGSVKRLELRDKQVRHFERAKDHPNARVTEITLVKEDD